MVYVSGFYGIHLDVCGLFGVVVGVFDSLLVVAFLPDFAVEVPLLLCAERKAAFDQLDGPLKGG